MPKCLASPRHFPGDFGNIHLGAELLYNNALAGCHLAIFLHQHKYPAICFVDMLVKSLHSKCRSPCGSSALPHGFAPQRIAAHAWMIHRPTGLITQAHCFDFCQPRCCRIRHWNCSNDSSTPQERSYFTLPQT